MPGPRGTNAEKKARREAAVALREDRRLLKNRQREEARYKNEQQRPEEREPHERELEADRRRSGKCIATAEAGIVAEQTAA